LANCGRNAPVSDRSAPHLQNRLRCLHGERSGRGAATVQRGFLRRIAAVRLGGVSAASKSLNFLTKLKIEPQEDSASLCRGVGGRPTVPAEIYEVPHRRPSLRWMALAVGAQGPQQSLQSKARRRSARHSICARRGPATIHTSDSAALAEVLAVGFARSARRKDRRKIIGQDRQWYRKYIRGSFPLPF